jgi:hypothetical protein
MTYLALPRKYILVPKRQERPMITFLVPIISNPSRRWDPTTTIIQMFSQRKPKVSVLMLPKPTPPSRLVSCWRTALRTSNFRKLDRKKTLIWFLITLPRTYLGILRMRPIRNRHQIPLSPVIRSWRTQGPEKWGICMKKSTNQNSQMPIKSRPLKSALPKRSNSSS